MKLEVPTLLRLFLRLRVIKSFVAKTVALTFSLMISTKLIILDYFQKIQTWLHSSLFVLGL